MRKILSFIPMILSLILLVISASYCFSVLDEMECIANTLGSSGIDYLGAGFGAFIVCLCSFIGWIFSIVSVNIVQNKMGRYISIVLMFVTALPMIFMVFLAFG